MLTHWGRVTHICVSKLTIIGSDNSLSPDRRQAIIWTNAGLLLIGPLGTNFSKILIEIVTLSLKKMRLNVSSAKRRPFCLGLNVLIKGAPTDTYMFSNWAIIGSGNGLLPVWLQAITPTSVDYMSVGLLWTNWDYQNFLSRKCISKCDL